jgi:hypothetical protein
MDVTISISPFLSRIMKYLRLVKSCIKRPVGAQSASDPATEPGLVRFPFPVTVKRKRGDHSIELGLILRRRRCGDTLDHGFTLIVEELKMEIKEAMLLFGFYLFG